jgi:hypothetical protein
MSFPGVVDDLDAVSTGDPMRPSPRASQSTMMASVEMVNVPYRGGAPAIADLVLRFSGQLICPVAQHRHAQDFCSHL